MNPDTKFQPTWATKPKPPPPSSEPPYKPTEPPHKPTEPARPILYNPKPPSSPRRRRRSVLCTFLLLAALIFAVVVVLAAVAAAVLYALYRPHAPAFSLTSLRISNLNLTSTFATSLTLSTAIHNPNSKIDFLYDPISVAVLSSSTQIAAGRLPAMMQRAGKTTRSSVDATSKGVKVGNGEISRLKGELRGEKRLDLEIWMRMKLKARIGNSSTKKIGFVVKCKGIKVSGNSKGKLSGNVKTSGVKCEGKLRYKIWKWNL